MDTIDRPHPEYHDHHPTGDFDFRLRQARGGDAEALRNLLILYRNYLKLAAGTRLDPDDRLQVDISEVVSDTLLWAYRHFPGFCGMEEKDLIAWLRRILAQKLKRELDQTHAGSAFVPPRLEAGAGSSSCARS